MSYIKYKKFEIDMVARFIGEQSIKIQFDIFFSFHIYKEDLYIHTYNIAIFLKDFTNINYIGI